MGRSAHEDPVHRRGGLDARCRVHDVPRDHRLARLGSCVEGDERLARGNAHADVQLEGVVALVERGDRVTGREGSTHGSLGIVLVRRRSTVDRDHGVADELLDGAAVPLQLTSQRVVVAA